MLTTRLIGARIKLILIAKVYSAPLKLQETPLTLAVNLSARFGCEVSFTSS